MRASDRDREQALDVLRRRCAEGYLSVDTFERRVEHASPEDGPILVGRSRRRDVVVKHPPVSRRHLELRPAAPGEWLALDVGSLNGTWLQNRRVGRTIVVPGDELWLGSCPVRLD